MTNSMIMLNIEVDPETDESATMQEEGPVLMAGQDCDELKRMVCRRVARVKNLVLICVEDGVAHVLCDSSKDGQVFVCTEWEGPGRVPLDSPWAMSVVSGDARLDMATVGSMAGGVISFSNHFNKRAFNMSLAFHAV